MDTIVYLLVFLVVITISIYIYNVYKDTNIEYFQNTPAITNNYIESDIFPNLPRPTNYIEIEYYSTIRGIQDEFISFISDYRNFKGDIDRNSDVNASLGGTQRTFVDPTRRTKLRDIKFQRTFTLRIWGGDEWTQTTNCYFYSQGLEGAYNNGAFYQLLPFVEPETFIDMYEKFKNYVSQFSAYSIPKFLRNNQIYNTNKLKISINPTNYLASNWYDLGDWINSLFNWKVEYKQSQNGFSETTISYDVGKLARIFPNRDAEIDNSVARKLRVYTYGSLNQTQSNDFKDSAFFGSLFNFNSTDYMNLYLRIPYLSSNLNGINLQYSHALFSNDVKPKNPKQTYLYEADNNAINYNNTLFNYLNLTNNTLTFPLSSDPLYINGNPSGGTCNLNSLTLKQQFVGLLNRKLVALMPTTLRKYITSWGYNRTLRILDRRLSDIGNDNTVKFYFLMGLALNNYYYSKNINNTTGMDNWKSFLSRYGLNNPDTAFGPEITGGIAGYDIFASGNSFSTDMGYGLILAYFKPAPISAAMTYRISDGHWWLHNSNYPASAIYTDTNHKYRRVNSTGTLPTINATLVSELYSYYTSYIQKVIPDYGIPLNVLDQRIMDSIAQEFYEKSEGLHEIIYIYDIYRIGSNMIDIRFDKKQRLDNIRYLNLRNQYIPQLNEYNKLLQMGEDDSWVNTYTNIDDYNIALSTSIGNLEPIFNPAYPVGGTFNYYSLIGLQRANNEYMSMLSARLNATKDVLKVQAGSNNLSNILSVITPQAGASDDTTALSEKPQNTPVYQDLTVIQSQYYSTVNAAQDLSNMINGIETNVARIFISLDNSNFTINAIALGINAALSYNTLYNGNIDTPLIGEGNANYQPTIRYTKNIKIPIQCGNVDFIKKAANLYRDTVFTDISNIVLSNIPYNSNDGFVVVDKILGFSQINDTTCGYTWVETQYDDLTNRPVKRNTVNIQLPFEYDESEYQNSQVIFDNNPAIMKYTSNSYPFGNLNSWIDLWAAEKRISIGNQITQYNSNIITFTNEMTNLAARSNIKFDFMNTTGWRTYSNITHLYMDEIAIQRRGRPPIIHPARWYQIQGQNVNTFIINNFSNKSYFQLFDATDAWHREYANRNGLYQKNMLQINNRSVYTSDSQNILSDPLERMQNATGEGGPFDPYIWGIVLNIFDYDTIPNFVNFTRENYNTANQARSETTTLISQLTTELNNLNTTVNRMKNSQETDPTIYNFILNNLVVIPRLLSDSDNKLNDMDGACPALRCENPTVMAQIMEQYNTDSNNPDKILNILNAYTVNEYQCDYKVTTLITPSNITANIILRNQLQSNISRINLLKIPANNSNLLTLNNEYNTLNSQFLQVNSNYQSLNNQINTSLTNGLNSSSNYINALNIKNENYNSLTIIINNLSNYVLNAFSNINLTSRYQTVSLGAGFDNNETLYDVLFNNEGDQYFRVNNWINSLESTNIIQTYQLLVQNNPDVFFYTDLYPNNKVSLVPSPDVDFLNLISQSNIANTNYQNSLTNFNNIATPLTASIQQSNIPLYNELTNLTNIRTPLQNSINLNRTNYQNIITLLTNQVNNLQSQFNSLGITSNSVFQQTKSFDIGVDIRDCSYYYGEVHNTGYFISENQNLIPVSNNKPGTTGFNYITTTFNTFNNETLNLINPLIDEANKQSSNMFNAILNQRIDTYSAIGMLNTISFSNAPPLSLSNILYLFQNNKRFYNSFFNLASFQYLESIKGLGITNSNTIQVLFNQRDNTSINHRETRFSEVSYSNSQIPGPPTTVCFEYGINITPNFLDYTAYLIKNVTINVTKEDIFNMSQALPYFNSNDNLFNNIPVTYTGNCNSRIYVKKTRIPTGSNYQNYQNIIVPLVNSDNQSILSSSNIYIGLLSRGYNENDIVRYAMDSNVDSNRNIVEFELKTTELLPFNKKFFKLQISGEPLVAFFEYLSGSSWITSEYLYTFRFQFRYIESKPEETFMSGITANPYDQNIIDLFHTYFNNLNKISASKPYNSIIGQVYRINLKNRITLQYSASVYHTDSANRYIDTVLPNEIFFNNLKNFEFIIMPASSNVLSISEFNEIQSFTGGQNINDFSRVTNLPSPELYRNLSQSLCFPPVNQETFTNSFIGYIDTTNLTTYLKNIIPLNLTSIFDISPRGRARGSDLTEVEYRDATNGVAYRRMNKSEFIDNVYFQYKFEITNSLVNYDTHSYSFILKPYYRTYYRVISEPLQRLYNSSEPTIIFPPYSNIIDFISDEYLYGLNFPYPEYTPLNDLRILLQFSFNNTGKSMIDTCTRNFIEILNNTNVINLLLLSNLNQSFTYNNSNYTNLNNFISLRNFNTNTNIYIESPTPRNQYIFNRTDETARAQVNFGVTNTGGSSRPSPGEYITLMTPSFINGHCYLHYGRPSLISNIIQRIINEPLSGIPEYGRRNRRNTFAYDYLLRGMFQCDYPPGYIDTTDNYKEITLVKNITSDIGYLSEGGFYVHPDVIPYDILFTPYQISGRICLNFWDFPYIILLRNIIPSTSNISQYASQNGYSLINYGPSIPSKNDDGSLNYDYEDRFKGAFTDYNPRIHKITDYKPYLFIKFESETPLLFETITLYNNNNKVSYKIKDKSKTSIILEVSEPIVGYSFITNNSGTSPNSWTLKGSYGKVWEVIHEESQNLEGKKLYQTPIFFLDGTNSTIEQPQSFEKPEIDVKKFVSYYKQKVNSSVNPEFKKYMYSNEVYYFIFDEYDLNNNLVAKDLIVGFEVYEDKVKKVILYEDDDGNYKPFDLRDRKQKEFWDSMIGLALDFQEF